MLYIVESRKSVERIATDLADAVVRNKFGVLGIHNLKETTAMIDLYSNPELKSVAAAVEATLVKIMSEATG